MRCSLTARQCKDYINTLKPESNVWMRYWNGTEYEMRKVVTDGSGGKWIVGLTESKKVDSNDLENLDYHNPIDLTGMI